MRKGLCAVGTVVLALLACSCSGGSKSAKTPDSATATTGRVATSASTQHFTARGYNLSFDHPSVWHESFERADDPPSTMGGNPIVFLSNAKLRDPCVRRPDGAVACGFPINALPPRGVLVTWATPYADLGEHPPTLPTAQGVQPTTTTIALGPYHASVMKPGDCGTISGDETISAVVGGYLMEACLRGPSLAQDNALIRDMLQSAHART